MKETIISPRVAKLAKEKGFNIELKSYYVEYLKTNNSDNSSFKTKKEKIEIEYSYFKNNSDSDLTNNNYICYGISTQSLLQKWLRDKFDIHVESIWIDTLSNLHVYRIKTTGNAIRPDSKFYYSYETALEEGLYHSLLLIKK